MFGYSYKPPTMPNPWQKPTVPGMAAPQNNFQQNAFKTPGLSAYKPPQATTGMNTTSPNYSSPLKPPTASSVTAPATSQTGPYNIMGPMPQNRSLASSQATPGVTSPLPYSTQTATAGIQNKVTNSSQFMPNSTGVTVNSVLNNPDAGNSDKMIAQLIAAGVPAWQLGTAGNQVSFNPFDPTKVNAATPSQRMESLPANLQQMLDTYNKANAGKDPWSVPSSLLPGTMLSTLPQWAQRYEAGLIPKNDQTNKQYAAFQTPEVQNAITAFNQHATDMKTKMAAAPMPYQNPAGMTQPGGGLYGPTQMNYSMPGTYSGGGSGTYSQIPFNPTVDIPNGSSSPMPYPTYGQSQGQGSTGTYSQLPFNPW